MFVFHSNVTALLTASPDCHEHIVTAATGSCYPLRKVNLLYIASSWAVNAAKWFRAELNSSLGVLHF